MSLAKITEVVQNQGVWGQPQIQEQQCGFVPEREILEKIPFYLLPAGGSRDSLFQVVDLDLIKLNWTEQLFFTIVQKNEA